jgi:protein-tyrosine phosphatase
VTIHRYGEETGDPYKAILGNGVSRIDEKHWQGGYPVEPERLTEFGFDVIVLAAYELQPDDEDRQRFPPAVKIICAPLDDDYNRDLKPEEIVIATNAANDALEALYTKKRVLVTCAAGRNRSGLISALMLMGRRGVSGKDAAAWVRGARAGALTNPRFLEFLERLPPQR